VERPWWCELQGGIVGGDQGKGRRGLATVSTRTFPGTPGSALPRPFFHFPVPVMMTRALECWLAWTDHSSRRTAGDPATRPDLRAVGRAVTEGRRPNNRPSLVIRQEVQMRRSGPHLRFVPFSRGHGSG